MFAVIHGVVGALVCGCSCFAVGPYVEVGDHFAVGLVVLVVFHVRQNRLFRFPVLPARSAAEVISVVLLDKGRISVRIRLYGIAFHFRDRGYDVLVGSGDGLLAEGQYAEGRGGRAKLKTTSVELVKRMPTSYGCCRTNSGVLQMC